MATPPNTLALGEAICLHLEAQIPAIYPRLRRVLRAQDLADVVEGAQDAPALHVLSAGDEVTGSLDAGRLAELDQRWLVVCAVRYVRRTASEPAEEDGGILRGAVCAVLQGARLLEGYGPLYRITGPKTAHRPGGYSYYPLLYAAATIGGADD